jgi:hypothetical protein
MGWLGQFLIAVAGGALIALLLVKIEHGVKWLLVLMVIGGVLSLSGLVRAEEIRAVDSACQGGQTETCTIGKAIWLAAWKGTLSTLAGLMLGGLGMGYLLENGS